MFFSLFSQFIPWYLPNKPSCISNNKAFQHHIAMDFKFASFKSSPYSNMLSKIPELIMISCWSLSFISMASSVHSLSIFPLSFQITLFPENVSLYQKKMEYTSYYCQIMLIHKKTAKYINFNVVFIHFTPQFQNIWTKHLHKVDPSNLFRLEWGECSVKTAQSGLRPVSWSVF